MNPEAEQFLIRRQRWLNNAVNVIKRHGPLLSDAQAREVAKIAILSWQDLRVIYDYAEAPEFIETLQ